MKKKLKDIVYFKADYDDLDIYYTVIETTRNTLDSNVYKYQEHDYKDRYIFADIKLIENIEIETKTIER